MHRGQREYRARPVTGSIDWFAGSMPRRYLSYGNSLYWYSCRKHSMGLCRLSAISPIQWTAARVLWMMGKTDSVETPLRFPWWLFWSAVDRVRLHPFVALFPVAALLVLLRLPIATQWLPLIGLGWSAAGMAAWGVALGYRLHWLVLVQRLLVAMAVVGGVFALVFWAWSGPGPGLARGDLSGRLLLLAFPLSTLAPLTYALFPGSVRVEGWRVQLADLLRFLLQGALVSPTGDHDGALRLEWVAWATGPSSLLVLTWILRHTVLVYPLFLLQLVLLAWIFPVAWSFWLAVYAPAQFAAALDDRR